VGIILYIFKNNICVDDIKRIMVSGPKALQEKCFMKCFGEGTEMVCLINLKIIAQNA
jgi:hypothetical protein